MNSVFSAFSKSNSSAAKSSDSSIGGGNSGSKLLNPTKKTPPRTPTDPTSYESLRHIREIAYCTNMNNFIANGDEEIAPSAPATPIQSPLNEKNIDVLGLDFSELDVVDCAPVTKIQQQQHQKQNDPINVLTISNNCASDEVQDSNFIENVKSSSSTTSSPHVNNREGYSSRVQKPRLSLSSVAGNNNAGMPAVHKRSNNGAINGNAPRTRLSTHQRNLSLDFR